VAPRREEVNAHFRALSEVWHRTCFGPEKIRTVKSM
jgi:hypothetical protein